MCSAWPQVPTVSLQPQTAFLPKIIPPQILPGPLQWLEGKNKVLTGH